MKLTNKVYDYLKWIGLILLPAIAWLYAKLSPIWGLPYPDSIPETINLFGTFLGILIGVSTYEYNNQGKGDFS